MASVQGNYGIPGYGDVKVTFGRQVENAKHVGLGESKAKVAAKNEPAAEPAAPAQAAAPPPLPEGVRVFAQPDGGEVWASQSGVKIRVDNQGDISNLEILGEGKMAKGPNGQYQMTGADGQPRPVSEFESEGKVLGYTYEKADKTQVYIHLDEMMVAYHSADKTVMQEVDASGGNLIHSVRDFQHANGRKEKLETRVYVSPQGEVESDGYTAGLEMHPGKMKFISPRNFPMEVDFVKPLDNLANYEMPAAKTAAAPPQAASANAAAPTPGPVQTPPNPPANAPLPQIHGTDIDVELPSQVFFKRDQTGQTSIQLRNGLTMVYRDGTAAAIEVATGTPLSVSTDEYQSRDGRREKTFLFKDTNGNAYRMFQQSQDFIVESADKKVVQHVLPNGAILGQVAADNGKLYKFEVGPRGNYVTDPGLDFQQKSGDKDVIFVPGADGQPVPMKLPYGIPENQSNAGMNADIHGTQKFPLSGQVLSAFQANNNQPQAPPQQGQFQGPGAPPPGVPHHPGGPQGGPPPMPPEMDPSIFPRPGMPQQSVSPSFMQRLKFFFSGNPNDLNVVPPQIPPDMRSMPRGHFATGPNGNSTPPFDMSGNQVGHGLGPGAPRQNAGPNYADASGGQQQTWGGQMPDGSHAPMPGTPNYYGSLNTNPMIANFQRDFEFQQQAMMRQLRWGQYATLALTGVTAVSSIASMFSYSSLIPSGLFVNPMSMLG